MKFIVVLFAVAVCALAEVAPLDEATKAVIADCVRESGTTQENAFKVADGDFSVRDEPVQCFFECFFRKTGLIDENGAFNTEKVISETSKTYNTKEGTMEDLINGCVKITGSNKCETTFLAYECTRAGTVKKV